MRAKIALPLGTRTICALVLGEAAFLYGLRLVWLPLALIVAGAQLIAWALLADIKPKNGRA